MKSAFAKKQLPLSINWHHSFNSPSRLFKYLKLERVLIFRKLQNYSFVKNSLTV